MGGRKERILGGLWDLWHHKLILWNSVEAGFGLDFKEIGDEPPYPARKINKTSLLIYICYFTSLAEASIKLVPNQPKNFGFKNS